MNPRLDPPAHASSILEDWIAPGSSFLVLPGFLVVPMGGGQIVSSPVPAASLVDFPPARKELNQTE